MLGSTGFRYMTVMGSSCFGGHSGCATFSPDEDLKAEVYKLTPGSLGSADHPVERSPTHTF